MLNLDHNIILNREAIKSPNLCDRFSEKDLQTIGGIVWDGYDRDKQSRASWEKRIETAMDLALQIQKDKNFPWPNCYSLDTEVLTSNGWKFIADVTLNDLVYSLDDFGSASFQPVTNMTRTFSEKMIHFYGKSIDLLVTPDHMMVMQDKLGRRKFLPAKDFLINPVTYRYIPLISESSGISPRTVHGIPVDSYMRLLGWYVSEGWAYYPIQNQKETTGSFGIAQSRIANPEKYEVITQLLKDCNISFSERDESFILHARSMPESLKEEFRSLGRSPDKKKLPRHIFTYGKEAIEALLETLVLGDGTIRKRNGHKSFYSSSKQLIDDVQELLQYAGLRGTSFLHTKKGSNIFIRNMSYVTNHDVYGINFNKKETIQVAKLGRHEIKEIHEVACVETLPYHTLYVRRNGKAVWCGNCSNVTFPLLTVASLQFHARAYPSIINGSNIVKCRIIGEDVDKLKAAKAERISTHMSYQVLEEDKAWEEQHDRLLLNLCIVGTTFIKTFYSANHGHNVSEMVLARDLVLNYWSKSVEETDRKTHVYTLSRNEIYERCLRGSFKDVLDEPWYAFGSGNNAILNTVVDLHQGINTPMQDHTTPLTCLEQHCSLDLDGDGYAEPYIITIDSVSKNVLRIVTRFDREEDIQRVPEGARKGQIISITPMEYFTKFGFIPSPDGGIYDIGFGTLTGPLNESVNSLVNQLLDSGTMANGGGGFLGRGAKIRGGAYTFAPFEWKRVDSTGDDLHKSIVPLPVREPSNVLLQLLTVLITYTNRISGSTDMMAGENPGQNTPAETSRTMVEQGGKIYNAIFKRIWRSMKEEFKKLYILNSLYLPSKQYFGHTGQIAMREDYLGDPSSVIPVADPNITSDEQRLRQAITLKQASMTTAGYDRVEIERRFLHALNIEGISSVFPGPDKVAPLPNPKLQIEQLKAQSKEMQLKADMLMFMTKLEEERRLNSAKMMELHARAAMHLHNADAIAAGSDLAELEGVLNVLKAHDESLGRQMKLIQNGMNNGQNNQSAGIPGMEGAPSNESSEQTPGAMAGTPAG